MLNTVSWWTFLGAVVLTVFYAMLNLTTYKEILMFKKTAGVDPTKMQKVVNDGVEPTKMQSAPEKRGVIPTPMQTAPAPTTNQVGSNNSGNTGNQK